MKVDPHIDVQKPQSLEQPAPARVDHRPPSTASAAPIGDDLGSLFNQEVELNSRALGRRQIGLRVMPVEQLAQLYEQLGHPAQATLATVARNVRVQLLVNSSVEKFLEITGNDPARAYVVLQQVAAQADAEVRSNEAKLAREALVKLEMRFKPQIQAGLNTALALQASSDDPQLRQAVRGVYYASVVTRQSLATMLQALLGLFGGDDFGLGLKLMRRALADDIAALTPSIASAKLLTLLVGLRGCDQLGGILCNCRDLIERLALTYPDVTRDAVALLQRLLAYSNTGIAAAEIQRLANELGGADVLNQVISLNSVYPVLKSLPLAVWRDTRGREECLNSFLLVMDEYARTERGARQGMALQGPDA
ncbi:type III secretion system gatekeeper subunit SctW [Pseudomonas sp. AN3A02]|uniref:type III secretion system gatekeeper subunit SctW n=1 Tax=Pseudomonas sp. AN3A02 TaxID=2719587 RepID=UPI0014301C2D|nr:type III secretion system gatekeeper subunit SctW [Pseudomonas sp. AN3A02]NIL20231.1 type III secretion system gatekeeper subunit SctW [Pseudomonas sp. AN3A02]